MSAKTLAITGATGFVGQTLVRLAVEGGWHVRALTRSPQPPRDGVTWISGALDQPASLDALTRSSDAIIHVAGVVNAPDRAGFALGNVDGTSAAIAAASRAGVSRFIHVSSLAAREPGLSDYGWSKAEAEAVVVASDRNWTMVRPPAIYGPGDKDMLDLFKMARLGFVLVPPVGRTSIIEVGDLARLMLVLVETPDAQRKIYEPDDGRPCGWSYAEFGRAIGRAVGRNVITVSTPRVILNLGAKLDRLARGAAAKLTADRAAYLCHADWVVSDANRVPSRIWTSQVDAISGLHATATAYRARGWL